MGQIIAIGILIFITILVILYTIKLYNLFVTLGFNVDKSFSNIDIILKQRVDEIPNLIAVIKQSTHYEQSTLTELTKLRSQFLKATKPDDRIKIGNKINHGMSSIMLVSEDYPELKASEGFINLQNRVSELEDHISDRREFYNESVNLHNIGIKKFPNVVLAKIMNIHNRLLLEVSESEKAYHGIKF